MANRMHKKKKASFPKLQLPSDKTKPTFENKSTRPEAMSTLTETSYLMAQLRPSRERKQKSRTRGGEQSRESTWEQSKQEGGKVERIKDKRKQKSHKTIEREKEGMQREAQASQKLGCRADRRSKQASQSPHSQSQEQS